jgi:VIT1/CCC1 family predicted Fe2+/Mn2+ transporter
LQPRAPISRRNNAARWAALLSLLIGVSQAAGVAFPILNIFVLHSGQVPVVAFLPFFIVYGCGSTISRFVRHFRQ